ncbi:MAG: hypothetical protein AABZ47_18200 [Planctomycetota bacterium]
MKAAAQPQERLRGGHVRELRCEPGDFGVVDLSMECQTLAF